MLGREEHFQTIFSMMLNVKSKVTDIAVQDCWKHGLYFIYLNASNVAEALLLSKASPSAKT
jgi:hypothetical protein